MHVISNMLILKNLNWSIILIEVSDGNGLKQQQIGIWWFSAETNKGTVWQNSVYFRGYGANAFKLQPMLTASHPQQSRYISLSHVPYDLAFYQILHIQIWNIIKKILILSAEVQIKKGLERETIEKMKSENNAEESLELLYWKLHGGNLYQVCLWRTLNVCDT